MSDTEKNIIVIGGTIAGMMSAIAAASSGARATIVSRVPLVRSSDVTGDEGISAVIHDVYGDSVEQHMRDTLEASCNQADKNFTRRICERAPVLVRFLARAGVLFNRTVEGNLEQTQEPGHAKPRTLHVDDTTAQHVVRILEEQVRRYEAKGLIDRQEYCVPLSFVIDEENRCRGVVIMKRNNHICAALKADAVVMTVDGYAGLYSEAQHTSGGLIVGNDHMTTLPGLFAAGSCTNIYRGARVLSGNAIAAKLVCGADAGESACSYVADLATHADELGESLFERASDREEKYNKGLMDRSDGENPYALADELKVVMDRSTSGDVDAEALENIAARTENIQLPDSSQWWNDSLIFARDLKNMIAQARKLF